MASEGKMRMEAKRQVGENLDGEATPFSFSHNGGVGI